MTDIDTTKPIYIVIQRKREDGPIDEDDDGYEPVYVKKILNWHFWLNEKIGVYQLIGFVD